MLFGERKRDTLNRIIDLNASKAFVYYKLPCILWHKHNTTHECLEFTIISINSIIFFLLGHIVYRVLLNE